MKYMAVCLAAAMVLAGCGGSGGGTGQPAIQANSAIADVINAMTAQPGGTTSQQADYYDELAGDLDVIIDPLDFQDPLTYPGSGSANFRGVLGVFDPVDRVIVAGDLSIDVSFAADSFDGTVVDIVAYDATTEEAIGGSLAITNGEIDRTVNVASTFPLTADIGGTLNSQGETVTVDGFMRGDFFDSATYMAGDVTVDTTSNGITDTLSGNWWAAENE